MTLSRIDVTSSSISCVPVDLQILPRRFTRNSVFKKAALIFPLCGIGEAATLFGPSLYFSELDSPWFSGIVDNPGEGIFLENFEDDFSEPWLLDGLQTSPVWKRFALKDIPRSDDLVTRTRSIF